MIEQELYFDGSTLVSHADSGGLCPTSATCELVSPAGVVAQSPTVTLPSFATTTASGSTTTALQLASVSGLQVHELVRVIADGVTYVREVARIDGTTVHLAQGLPVAPDSGCPVVGLTCRATITAPGAGAIGADWRIRWTLTDATRTERTAAAAMVVRWPWPTDFPSASDVIAQMREMGQLRGESFARMIAQHAGDAVRSGIIASGQRPSMWLSTEIWRPTVIAAIRAELAQVGVHFGSDAYAAQRETRFAFTDQLERVLRSAHARDADLDGVFSADERQWKANVIRIRRG